MSERRMRLHDEFLTRAVAEVFHHDKRLQGLEVDVRFDGGVAHLTGAVAHAGELDVVRALIGRLAGVFAVWDRVRVAGREPVVLDVGCGAAKQYSTNIGVDVVRTGEVDVVADVSRNLPFADRSADRVFLVHILEHLVDFLPLLDEVHRVLRPDGVAHVMSPWWRHVNAVADPTHVRLLDVQTIKGVLVRPGSDRRWYPLHAGCDGASVFADLRPAGPGDPPATDVELARFFD